MARRSAQEAWVELSEARADRTWTRFEEFFRFRPSVDPANGPTFRAPAPSRTWRIRDELDAFSPWEDDRVAPYARALVEALKACVNPSEPVLALDWQHASYAFYPYRLREAGRARSWRIPALPSGEYHLFVTEDFRLGSLGHPWEQTILTFGEGFVDEYARRTPLAESACIRRETLATDRPRRERKDRPGFPRRRFRNERREPRVIPRRTGFR